MRVAKMHENWNIHYRWLCYCLHVTRTHLKVHLARRIGHVHRVAGRDAARIHARAKPVRSLNKDRVCIARRDQHRPTGGQAARIHPRGRLGLRVGKEQAALWIHSLLVARGQQTRVLPRGLLGLVELEVDMRLGVDGETPTARHRSEVVERHLFARVRRRRNGGRVLKGLLGAKQEEEVDKLDA